jgi:hypothetical protein
MGMHPEECGYYHGHMKQMNICAMIFFGLLALIFAMIAGVLHLRLHMMDE